MVVLTFTPSISGKTGSARVLRYDLWNQHPSISQKRIFRSLHFTKNIKIDTCVILHSRTEKVVGKNMERIIL
jgi:hypothetical protein